MEIFSLFKEMRGRGSIHSCEAISPPRAPPLRPRSFVVRCGDVCMYWWGDGCCGIGYKTLCRFIPILHNFLQSITYSPQTTRKLSLSSTPSSAALTAHPLPSSPTHTTAMKSQPVRRVLPVDGLCRRGADSWLAEICVASKILTV